MGPEAALLSLGLVTGSRSAGHFGQHNELSQKCDDSVGLTYQSLFVNDYNLIPQLSCDTVDYLCLGTFSVD